MQQSRDRMRVVGRQQADQDADKDDEQEHRARQYCEAQQCDQHEERPDAVNVHPAEAAQ